MTFFNHPEFHQHEQVCYFSDAESGLRAIIAVHNTALGPALGGCRMWAYPNDGEALRDVLRLSRGMTYKAAVAGLPLGGGKSVIIGDATRDKTARLMRAMGTAVERMGGRYIIAEDVGTSVEDMQEIHRNTSHVVGLPTKRPDGKGDVAGGDPSPVTAFGVFTGLKASWKHRTGKEDLSGVRVAVQGLGHVGYNLCRNLHGAGARLFVTDVNKARVEEAVQEFSATPVALDAIISADVDIFAPCALGAILNDANIAKLKAGIVSGAANNQLAEARHGDVLRSRGILYAPDYVINAGGLISVYYEFFNRTADRMVPRDEVMAHVQKIGDTLGEIYLTAEKEGISTSRAADRIAEQRFQRPQAGGLSAAAIAGGQAQEHPARKTAEGAAA